MSSSHEDHGLNVEEEGREGTQQKTRGRWRNGGKELEEEVREREE